MKILLLNPHIDAGHNVVTGLSGRGVTVLLCIDVNDAWSKLQQEGETVDFVLLHREAKNDQGEAALEILARLKKDKKLMDLPVIVSSSVWKDSDFAKHQKTPDGANAYLKFPFTIEQLNPIVDGVLGSPLPSAVPSAPAGDGGMVLESATRIFLRTDVFKGTSGIQLEMPEGTSPAIATVAEVAAVAEAPVVAEAPAVAETPIAAEVPAVPDEPLVAADTSEIASTALPAAGGADAGTAEGLETAPQIIDEKAGAASEGIALADASAESVLELSVAPEKDTISTSPAASLSSDPLPALPAMTFDEEIPSMQEAPSQEAPSLSLSSDLSIAEGFSLAPTESAPADAISSIPTAGSGIDLSDQQAESEMPYLFSKGAAPASLSFAQPQGDAIIPGGAANSPDIETMKKYLLLREQDVAALSVQLETAKDQIRSLEEQLRAEHGKGAELSHVVSEQEKKIHGFEHERSVAGESLESEMAELKFQVKVKTDKAKLMEAQVRDAQTEIDRLKDRVRQDIRKIRVREKELENRLEILKKDSEALIGARENKIVELKRKLDLLEFNMDLLQDQYNREKENSAKLRERLAKAAQVSRVFGGLLDAKAEEDAA